MHLGTTLICHRGTDQREPSAATPTAASQQPAVGRSCRSPAAEAAGRKASRPYSPPPPRPAHVRRAVGEDAQVHRHVRLQVQESQRARPQLVEAELEQVRAPAVGGRPAATGPPPPQPGRRLRHSACLWELVRSRPAGPPVSALENQLVERPAPVLADSDKPSARVHREIMVKTEILGSTLLGAPKCSIMKANSFCQFLLHLNVI